MLREELCNDNRNNSLEEFICNDFECAVKEYTVIEFTVTTESTPFNNAFMQEFKLVYFKCVGRYSALLTLREAQTQSEFKKRHITTHHWAIKIVDLNKNVKLQ